MKKVTPRSFTKRNQPNHDNQKQSTSLGSPTKLLEEHAELVNMLKILQEKIEYFTKLPQVEESNELLNVSNAVVLVPFEYKPYEAIVLNDVLSFTIEDLKQALIDLMKGVRDNLTGNNSLMSTLISIFAKLDYIDEILLQHKEQIEELYSHIEDIWDQIDIINNIINILQSESFGARKLVINGSKFVVTPGGETMSIDLYNDVVMGADHATDRACIFTMWIECTGSTPYSETITVTKSGSGLPTPLRVNVASTNNSLANHVVVSSYCSNWSSVGHNIDVVMTGTGSFVVRRFTVEEFNYVPSD